MSLRSEGHLYRVGMTMTYHLFYCNHYALRKKEKAMMAEA
jgi:hypothetical protein